MSGWSPQLADWMKNGLDWIYVRQSTISPFTLGPGEMLQVPRDYTYKGEGVMLTFSGAFDHPKCGIRMEAAPEFDTETRFTVATLSLGLTLPEILVYTLVPPAVPPGYYAVRVLSPWVWKDWCRLYVFNDDTVPHRCLGHGYWMVVLREPRKGRGDED